MRYTPGLILGVFMSRLGGELVGLPGWWAAVLLSLLLGLAGAWLLARRPLAETWPALLLLTYIVLPEADPRAAAWVAAVAGVCWWLTLARPAGRPAGTRLAAVLPLGLGVAFFLLYLVTLAPDVLPADSGEFQTVAATLGVAHPPGFPLYTMLAHMMTRLPLGMTAAYQVNLFSALTSTLTVLVVYLTVMRLGGHQLAAIVAAVALGTATTFWTQATTANIRSLTGLFTALILFALLEFRRRVAVRDGTGADRWLMLTALFFGLGVTHHVSLAFLAPLALPFLLLADRPLVRTPRRWLRPILAGLAGLLPLLYLPWRAGSGARGADPDMATLDGFLEHVLARGFSGDFFYFSDPASLWQRTRILGNIWENQFAPLVLAGIVAGLLVVVWRDRLAGLLLGGSVLIFAAVAATYRAPQTVEYLMPAYVASAIGLGYGLSLTEDSLVGLSPVGKPLAHLLSAVLLVSAVGQAVDRYASYVYFRDEGSARHVVDEMLAGAPPDATILAHWHWATPLWYLQDVDGERPDVSARFVFPQGEPYEATWARRTRESVAAGVPVITTYYEPGALADLPPPLPLGEAYLFPTTATTTLPDGFVPLDARFAGEGEVGIVGYSFEGRQLPVGDMGELTVAWEANGLDGRPASMVVQMIGSDGRVIAQDDQPLTARPEGLTLTQFRLTPRPGSTLGPVQLVAGVYTDQPWLTGSGEQRVSLGQAAVGASVHQPFSGNPVYRPTAAENGATRRLIGYDWDMTLPETPRLYLHWQTAAGYESELRDGAEAGRSGLRAYRGWWGVWREDWEIDLPDEVTHHVPLGSGITWSGESLPPGAHAAGDALVLDNWFHSDRPQLRDYVVSARLIGLQPDSRLWAWWDLADAIPGLGAYPTLKWIEGSEVLSPHRVTVSPDAPDGQALMGALTMYDAFTLRPLPVLDERILAAYAWIPMGEARVGE